MPIRIKSVDQITSKWKSRAGVAGADYTDGVKNPRRPQAEAAIAANESWKAGTQAAIAEDRFVKGVAAAGNTKWQEKSVNVGSQRYGPGVAAAVGDFSKGIAPFREALATLDLPSFPKGDPRGITNVEKVNTTLRALRLQRG